MALSYRRIDQLGRIVIPKEIREQLRIRDGENLIIRMVGEDILLTKQTHKPDLKKYSFHCLELLSYFIDDDILITDRDHIIVSSKNIPSMYNLKLISDALNKKIGTRNFTHDLEMIEMIENAPKIHCFVEPIVKNGDLEGMVIIHHQGEDAKNNAKRISTFLSNII